MPTYSNVGSGGVSRGGASVVPVSGFVLLTNADITMKLVGSDISIAWTSQLPGGTWYQVYIDGALFQTTTSKSVLVPANTQSVKVSVAAVPPAMADTDFSSRLPVNHRQKALLTWLGGPYLGADIAGYNIYSGSGAADAVDFTKPIATVPASSGVGAGGFGVGGFGGGGFGSAAAKYQWESGTLAAGTWNFAVKSVDVVGNESAPRYASCVIVGPPQPPAPFPDGLRLHCQYDAMTHIANLTWNPSPSA